MEFYSEVRAASPNMVLYGTTLTFQMLIGGRDGQGVVRQYCRGKTSRSQKHVELLCLIRAISLSVSPSIQFTDRGDTDIDSSWQGEAP